MWLPLIAAMLIQGTQAPAPEPQPNPATSYKTNKSLDQVQKCLTAKLSEVGEVVAVKSEEKSVTLVLRDIPDGPMTIDIDPPMVTVTSKPAENTRPLIRACL